MQRHDKEKDGIRKEYRPCFIYLMIIIRNYVTDGLKAQKHIA